MPQSIRPQAVSRVLSAAGYPKAVRRRQVHVEQSGYEVARIAYDDMRVIVRHVTGLSGQPSLVSARQGLYAEALRLKGYRVQTNRDGDLAVTKEA